jgi:hypothetical protein
VGYPSWSRVGKYIYFDNIPYQRESAFFRVRIGAGKLEEVTSFKDLLQRYGILGVWKGLASDDSPLLLRNTGSQEEIASGCGPYVLLDSHPVVKWVLAKAGVKGNF